MIATTNGYFARDWSLELGWNNMRYIIEAAILQAGLLNRTLVLPSFVYALACEHPNGVCAKYAPMANRNDAIGSDERRHLPMEKQMAWRIPIEVMIDIPHLRQRHKVITMSEYLILQGLDITYETSHGRWDRDYHCGIDHPTLFMLQSSAYDPTDIARVDTWDPAAYQRRNFTSVSTEMAVRCDEELKAKSSEKESVVLSWGDASRAINDTVGPANETEVELALEAAGWIVLHTFDGHAGMDFTKTVIKPIKVIARHDSIHGFLQEYKNVSQNVFLLEGEIHLARKPGFLLYTTEEARDDFARIVLQDLRTSDRVHALAEKVVSRMSRLNDGRTWMAAHMRRGDSEVKIEDHFQRIMDRLGDGRTILERIQHLPPEPYDVPDVEPNLELSNKKPPAVGDYIYLATDERSQDGLRYLRENQALLFDDLVEQEIDEHSVGLFYLPT